MALSDVSFKLYDNAGLTVLTTSPIALEHNSDLSDNPQILNKYFGSPTVNRVLKAASNPGVDQITITPTVILPVWVASTAYTLGQSVTSTTHNGYRYVVSTAGTTGASEPTWPTSGLGSTVVSGSVLFTLTSVAHLATEIKLSLTEAGLGAATAGAALNIGTTIDSGSINKIDIWIEIDNAVTVVSNNAGTPELSLNINAVNEYSV